MLVRFSTPIYRRPCSQKVHRQNPRTRQQPKVKCAIDFQKATELTGKFLGLFVLFTSSMNWYMYRRIRKETEKEKEKKD